MDFIAFFKDLKVWILIAGLAAVGVLIWLIVRASRKNNSTMGIVSSVFLSLITFLIVLPLGYEIYTLIKTGKYNTGLVAPVIFNPNAGPNRRTSFGPRPFGLRQTSQPI